MPESSPVYLLPEGVLTGAAVWEIEGDLVGKATEVSGVLDGSVEFLASAVDEMVGVGEEVASLLSGVAVGFSIAGLEGEGSGVAVADVSSVGVVVGAFVVTAVLLSDSTADVAAGVLEFCEAFFFTIIYLYFDIVDDFIFFSFEAVIFFEDLTA
ncbi:hypothetical protein KQI69_03075 [Eubacterium sp. MSJ-13]|uniref:hypothetical protein n=1 Tax=Eubacterium sp. MSJ-13 TaxID=2841513 RepID=UPI001C1149D1|nr:hypothetical protein [Eubacterium sp. MSJ-13]MBU5478180.1 hypothetical protein [Eubacterium sp. MSJ-13]